MWVFLKKRRRKETFLGTYFCHMTAVALDVVQIREAKLNTLGFNSIRLQFNTKQVEFETLT